MFKSYICITLLLFHILSLVALSAAGTSADSSCTIRPLGAGQDDTTQVQHAIDTCGENGTVVFEEGNFNITRKMTWNLLNSRVDLHGLLNFQPTVEFWLNASNTYRVVFIQSQASWFVITGHNFTVDAHDTGGIDGNGQTWWNFYSNRTREDGDGRPISLTLSNVTQGNILNFHIIAPPFWCNIVADSEDVIYRGMLCNATNSNPEFFGTNLVPNTDGIDTYRSNRVLLENWDITCGDDCLAIKGNSTNVVANNITCRGGNGVAFGSLGQYVGLDDQVENVTISNVRTVRLDSAIQPNMASGVYLKTWTGSVNGEPPTGGGGGGGFVRNVLLSNVSLDRVDLPTHLYQTNGGHSDDVPSTLQFSNITWVNWTGTSTGSEIVELDCSPAVPCPNMVFLNFNATPPAGDAAEYSCSNVINETGLPSCT
ncbi:pectin lyase-like protein [Amylostereum chailletii]|nr:pectin lyase-like protein [Amylostereum chailletii]